MRVNPTFFAELRDCALFVAALFAAHFFLKRTSAELDRESAARRRELAERGEQTPVNPCPSPEAYEWLNKHNPLF